MGFYSRAFLYQCYTHLHICIRHLHCTILVCLCCSLLGEAVCPAFLNRNGFQAEKIIIIFTHFFCLINFLSWCLSIPGMCITLLTQDYAEQVRNLQKIKEKLEIALEKHQDCTYFFSCFFFNLFRVLFFKWNNSVWLSLSFVIAQVFILQVVYSISYSGWYNIYLLFSSIQLMFMLTYKHAL